MSTKKQPTTKTATGSKYVNLITKSDSQVQAEQVEFAVERAKNSLEKSVLDVKGQSIDKQSLVKTAQLAHSDAQKALERAKSANPLNPQKLIDAFQGVKQAELNVLSAQEEQKQVEEVLEFLQNLESELF